MNPRRILIALSLAFFVSGVCTWFISRKLRPPTTYEKAKDVLYVAASQDLQAGETLKADNTVLVPWPASSPIEGTFAQQSDVIGRQVIYPFGKGQPILDRGLSAPGSGTGLASEIPDGMRAVGLRSDEVIGVGGFLVPGSHLDVLLTYRPDSSPDPLTVVILQNALVLAAGHQTEPDPHGKPLDATLVTLLLSPDDSQRVVLASSQGAIHFAMRNDGDAALAPTTPVLLSQLSGRPVVAARPASRPAVQLTPPAPKPREIQTILGGASR